MILFTIMFGVPIYLMTERFYPIKIFEMRMKLMKEYFSTCKEAAKLKLKIEAAEAAEQNEKVRKIKENIDEKEEKRRRIEAKLLDVANGGIDKTKAGDKDWELMLVKIAAAYTGDKSGKLGASDANEEHDAIEQLH